MATWMLYSLMVGAMLIIPALCLDVALRMLGKQRRWVWAGGLTLIAMTVLSPLRPTSVRPAFTAVDVVEGSAVSASRAEPPVGAPLARSMEFVAGLADAPLRAMARQADGVSGWWLGLTWLALSGALTVVGGATIVRYRTARRRWPLAAVAGREVRIAPDAGPAVIGVVRPEIVVPAWLLERTADEQRLVVAHEYEHLRRRDPVLLAAGCLVVAALPWNPAAWWMLGRLRLAVEMDCDSRVLRTGVGRNEYGRILIDLAGRNTGLPLAAAALAASSNNLRRRIVAMTRRNTRWTGLRAAALTAVAVAALFAACEARMPTSAEIEEMDVAAVESHAGAMIPLQDAENVSYEIDGVAATAEEARALDAARIATIDVMRSPEGGTVRIRTRSEDAAGDEPTVRREMRIERVGAGEGDAATRNLNLDEFAGILFIDGERTDPARMRTLEPGEIVKVEVIKGSAAVEMYGEEAEGGVIRITTRAAGEG